MADISAQNLHVAQHQHVPPINSLRVIAFAMLVSYHVVGYPTSGLELDYPHILRCYADFLVGVRMPIFAVIAGYVYGLRPMKLSDFRVFTSGKIRRLLIPGAIAALLFAATSSLMQNTFARTWSDLWGIFFYSYAHYWYLQTMMIIFVMMGFIDALLKGRFTVWLMLAAFAISVADIGIQSAFFSVYLVPYLLPYFLLGLVFVRHLPLIWTYRLPILAACGIAVTFTTFLQYQSFVDTGAFPTDRRAWHASVFGVSACCLLLMLTPKIKVIEWLAPFAFTIYLYHVFGTAGMRELLHALQIFTPWVNFFAGIVGGIALPIVLHKLANRFSLSRKWVLGARA